MKIKTKHNSFKYTFLELRVLLPSFQFNYTESHFPQLAIKKDCLYTTFSQMSSRYNDNYLNNLNCWLAAYKKEADDFTADIPHQASDSECNLEMANALQARQNQSWYDKETLVEKNDAVYKKMEADFNNQLKNLK